MAGPNILNFGSKVVFLNGLPLTLPSATSNPGTATAGDLYYNSTSNTIEYYNGSSWISISAVSLTGQALTNGYIIVGNGSNQSIAVPVSGDISITNTGFTSIISTSNATLTTLSALSLPGSQVTGNISGTAANITATSNSTLTTLTALSLPGSQVTGNISGNAANISATSNATLTILSALTTATSLAISGSQVSGGTFGAVNGSALTNLSAANLSGILPVGVTGGSGLSIATSQLTGSVSLTSQVSGILPITNGGTNASSAASAFANLSPMTTAGDIIYENATPAPARLAIGTVGQVLTVVSGLPAWATAAVGSVTSVGLADGSTTPIYSISNSPVTSSGTLTFTLNTQSANSIFAGPSSGSAAQPNFRSLVVGDLSFAGAANGIATLDSGGKVPVAQLPNGVFVYQGLYNPATNTPTLADGTGTEGQVYYISTAYNGTVAGAFGGASLNFSVGDLAIYNGTQWELTTPAAGVSSVNSTYGAVVISMATANGFAGTYSGTALTVSTTITGLLKGNGTAISAAVAGTDYIIPSGSITGTAANITATSNSTLTTLTALSLPGSQVTGNISGNAANVTGTVAIANGGTGQTTQQAAINALAGAVTSGDYLRGNGTNVVMSAIQVSDVPTLNQNTTGTAANITATSNSTLTTLTALSLPGSQVTGNISGNAANVTGTVAIANGGTNAVTAAAAFNNLSPMTTTGDIIYEVSTGVAARLAIGSTNQVLTVISGIPAWATPTTGTVTAVSVASANGFAGTSSGGATPALTLSTTITGILQGNGTAISAATTTGSGSVVLATSPTLVTPVLGTPTSVTLTNATGLPLSTGVTGILPVANATLATNSLGTVTTSVSINWTLSNVFTMTLTNSDTCVISFSGAVSGQVIVIKVANAATTGSGALTWPTSYWANGVIPTMTTGAGAIDVYTIIFDGTNYYGSAVQAMAT